MMAMARVSAIGISQDSLIRRLPRTSAAPLFSANQFGHPVRNGSTSCHHRICRGEHFPCAAVMVASRGTDDLQTRRWREPDSNHRSLSYDHDPNWLEYGAKALCARSVETRAHP